MNYIIFHTDFSNRAGTERVLYSLLEYLSSESTNKVTLLLASKEKGLVYNVNKLNIEINYLYCELENNSRISLLFFYKKLFFKLRDYYFQKIRNTQTVLICSNHLLSSLSYIATKGNNNLKIVGCEHFSINAIGFLSFYMRKLIYKKIYVITLTDKARDFIDTKFKPIKTICIPNASPFDISATGESNSKTILSIGRYVYEKGFDLLLQAFALISDEFKNWNLKIIGDDFGDKSKLESLIVKNNLQNVELIPSTDTINDYYKSASFYVMSSRSEGFPMVLLESLSFGLPIISFNCPTGPEEIIDGTNGILVENGNIEKLAEAMKLLITKSDYRSSLAKGALISAEKYSKSVINDKWNDFFYNLWK